MANTVAKLEDVQALKVEDIQLTLDAVLGEVLRQDVLARAGKFGGTHVFITGPNDARLAALVEEVGEVARELCEARITGTLNGSNLIKELIQVAACGVAWATAADHESGEGT